MATDKKFTFYNVDNGQSVLITLDDDTHLLFDLKQRPEDAGKDDKTAEVHSELLSILPQRNGRRRLSVFALSHGDLDHCQGTDRVFLLKSEEDGKNEDEKLIGIDELWVTAHFLAEKFKADDSRSALHAEAHRRFDLWTSDNMPESRKDRGNRIVVFGWSDELEGIDRLPQSQRRNAGDKSNEICGEVVQEFDMFVHGPFRYSIDSDSSDEQDRNDDSMILHIRVTSDRSSGRLLIGGDAMCAKWRTVYEKTVENKNHERLDWDIFFVPHHGSYKFFTEKDGDEGRKEAKDDPAETSMKLLGHGQQHGWLVCSSRPTSDANYPDKDPPHTEATGRYEARAEEIDGEFVCLMEQPDKDNPEPLVLRLTKQGLQRSPEAAVSVVGSGAVGGTQRWGLPR